MEPGVYAASELPNEAYHRGPGVSNSGLKLIGDKSPFHYWAQYLNPDRPTDLEGPAGAFLGTAIHAATLEPHVFAQQYIVNPYDDRRGNRYKDLQADNPGKAILSKDEFRSVQGMHRALYSHPKARALLLDAAAFEESMYVTDPHTGMLLRIRPDLRTNSNILVDLKKTQDSSHDAFRRSVERYGYDHQDAFYTDVFAMANYGELPRAFLFIAAEEKYPHAVNVFCLEERDRENGRIQWRKNLDIYAHCMATGKWPSYSEQVEALELSRWHRQRFESFDY